MWVNTCVCVSVYVYVYPCVSLCACLCMPSQVCPEHGGESGHMRVAVQLLLVGRVGPVDWPDDLQLVGRVGQVGLAG